MTTGQPIDSRPRAARLACTQAHWPTDRPTDRRTRYGAQAAQRACTKRHARHRTTGHSIDTRPRCRGLTDRHHVIVAEEHPPTTSAMRAQTADTHTRGLHRPQKERPQSKHIYIGQINITELPPMTPDNRRPRPAGTPYSDRAPTDDSPPAHDVGAGTFQRTQRHETSSAAKKNWPQPTQ